MSGGRGGVNPQGTSSGRGPVLDQQRHEETAYAPDALGPGGLLAAKDAQLADGGRESLAEGRHRRQGRAG